MSDIPGDGREFAGELLCLACLGETITGGRRAVAVAVTLAPMLWPPGRADGVPVAVPACWEHVQQAAKWGQQSAPSALVAPPGPGKIRPRGRG